MALLIISFIAGVLTVLSPCVLPLLPVVVGGSLVGGTSFRRAATVTVALGISVFLFTIILKVSTLFINVPQAFWTWFSGGLIVIVGIVMLFPQLYDRIGFLAKANSEGSKLMSAGFMRQSFWGDVIVGAALGPVFSTCSPTYFIVLASVLPVSLALGLADIFAYILGLCLFLLFISFVGQRAMARFDIVADPNGVWKRVLGIIFIVIGLLIITGYDKVIEAPLYSVFDETVVEQHLLAANAPPSSANAVVMPITAATSTGSGPVASPLAPAELAEKEAKYPIAPELQSPDAYLNTGGQPITLSQYRGKDVVLIDFWTYSCINCQRTLPYLATWYSKYKDQGLVIIGVHTPEFAFEHVESNVAAALKQFGITYPVVLDNEYKTWNAYGNEYWPQEYLIDIDGFIVDSHSGEGNYDQTEAAIQAALKERAERMGLNPDTVSATTTSFADPGLDAIESPETYFGSNRNQFLANGTPGASGTANFTLPATAELNQLYLGGSWDIEPEYATAEAGDTVEYTYDAHDIYIVAAASGAPVTAQVLLDGQPVGAAAGADVDPATSLVTIQSNRLYKLVHEATPGVHTLELKLESGQLQAYTFTFG